MQFTVEMDCVVSPQLSRMKADLHSLAGKGHSAATSTMRKVDSGHLSMLLL